VRRDQYLVTDEARESLAKPGPRSLAHIAWLCSFNAIPGGSRLAVQNGGDARGMDVEAGSPTVTASQGGTAPAEYLRLAAIRDWRRVEHRPVLVPGGDQPDCAGNAGARPRCAGGQG
jgi:hypothetical protein